MCGIIAYLGKIKAITITYLNYKQKVISRFNF